VSARVNLNIISETPQLTLWNAVLPIRLISIATWGFDTGSNYTHNDLEKRFRPYSRTPPYPVFQLCHYRIAVIQCRRKTVWGGGSFMADITNVSQNQGTNLRRFKS